jgi:hypothetical protein
LDGTLQVLLIDGFLPAAGDVFDILDWGNLSGAFDTLQLPDIDTALNWNASRLYVDGTLRVGISGDYNLDGSVGAADYVVWRKTDGTQPGYNTWRANFGRTAAGGSGAAAGPRSAVADVPASAVPEPSAIMLAIIVGLAFPACFIRRRK